MMIKNVTHLNSPTFFFQPSLVSALVGAVIGVLFGRFGPCKGLLVVSIAVVDGSGVVVGSEKLGDIIGMVLARDGNSVGCRADGRSDGDGFADICVDDGFADNCAADGFADTGANVGFADTGANDVTCVLSIRITESPTYKPLSSRDPSDDNNKRPHASNATSTGRSPLVHTADVPLCANKSVGSAAIPPNTPVQFDVGKYTTLYPVGISRFQDP
jgi:hypothetical protein